MPRRAIGPFVASAVGRHAGAKLQGARKVTVRVLTSAAHLKQ